MPDSINGHRVIRDPYFRVGLSFTKIEVGPAAI